MKKIMIMLLAISSVTAVVAQKRIRGGGSVRGGGAVRVIQPRVGFNMGYMPYYGYSAFGSPFYMGMNPFGPTIIQNSQPSKLQMKIEDIKSDYDDRIYSAKKDLSGKAKRQQVRQLKQEREAAIDDLERNYYKTRR